MNFPSGFAPALALTLLHSLWQVALLALLASTAFALLNRRSAALRHTVGMVVMLAMLLAPLITFAMLWRAPSLAGTHAGNWGSWWMAYASQLWLLGVVLMLALQLGGLHAVYGLRRRPWVALPGEWQRKCEALRQQLGIARAVLVCMAEHVSSPFTAHLFRPIIWLPLGLITRLPADQVEALLAHELAHIVRLDWLWNGLQCVIESLLFFHPAVWWLSRRIRQEREHACDDLAVAVCGDAIPLAQALAELHRHSVTIPPFALAAQGGSLMSRVSHILSVPTRRHHWRAPAALLLLLCSGTLMAMQLAPPAPTAAEVTPAPPAPPPAVPAIPAVPAVPAVAAAAAAAMPAMPALPAVAAPPLPPLPPLPPRPPAPPELADAGELHHMTHLVEREGSLPAKPALSSAKGSAPRRHTQHQYLPVPATPARPN